jgi:hypothetical protein
VHLVLQLLARAVQENRHVHLRHAEHACDLGVRMALEESQREDFRRPWSQGGEGAPETVAQFPLISGRGGRIVQGHDRRFLARAHQVERSVNGGAAEIAFGIIERLRRAVAAQQAQENRLEHVFGVGGVAGDAVRRTEDESVTVFENALDIAGDRRSIVLSDREFQGAPPVSVTTKDRVRGRLLQAE